MATHGKKQRLMIGGYDMACIGRLARQNFAKDLAPADTFCLDDHEFEAGQKGGNFYLEGIHKGDHTAVEYLIEEMVSGIEDNPEVLYGPAGFDVGAQVFMAQTHHNSCEVGGDNKSVVTVNCSFEAEGGIAEGVLLVSPYL